MGITNTFYFLPSSLTSSVGISSHAPFVLLILTSFLITSRSPLTSAASARSLVSSSAFIRDLHPDSSISSSTLSNYSFPDSPVDEGYTSGDVTDVFGHHMHVMEGDIAVSEDFENEVEESRQNWRKIANYAVKNDFRIWQKGRIPYVIDGSLWNGRGKILKAMRHIESKTCVTFVPRKGEKNYVRIYQGGHRSCYSMIGKTGGGQGISLGSGCLIHGVIVHELMHAIGFYHMHSRSDRDKYLEILWQNINSNMQSQFRKNSPNQDLILRPFDYQSIMLYGPKLFSSNGRDTMIPKRRGIRLMDTGVKGGLSDEDARSINMLYGCSPRNKPGHEREEEDVAPTTSVTSPSITTINPPRRKKATKKSINIPRRRSWKTTTFRTSTSTYKPPSTASITTTSKSTSTSSSVTKKPPGVKPKRRKWNKFWDKMLQTPSPLEESLLLV